MHNAAVTSHLTQGEQVIVKADAVFRSGPQVRRGLVVLTNQRLICIDGRSQHDELLDFRVATITAVEAGKPHDLGDATRGDLTILAGGITTHITRIRPWECAGEIAHSIRDSIAARAATQWRD
jgi:hypothetical protein